MAAWPGSGRSNGRVTAIFSITAATALHAFLSVRVLGELRLSYLNAGPTELRLVLIGLTLSMLIAGREHPIFFQLNIFDLFVGSVGVLLISLFVVQTARIAKRLALEDPSTGSKA